MHLFELFEAEVPGDHPTDYWFDPRTGERTVSRDTLFSQGFVRVRREFSGELALEGDRVGTLRRALADAMSRFEPHSVFLELRNHAHWLLRGPEIQEFINTGRVAQTRRPSFLDSLLGR